MSFELYEAVIATVLSQAGLSCRYSLGICGRVCACVLERKIGWEVDDRFDSDNSSNKRSGTDTELTTVTVIVSVEREGWLGVLKLTCNTYVWSCDLRVL